MTTVKATTVRTMPQLIKTVKAIHAKAMQAADRAEQLWITLGIELKEAKARNKEEGQLSWPEFAKKHFDFGQSRADELIRIADGRTSVETVRASGAARVQKHAKAKPALANAGSSKAMVPVDHDDSDDDDDGIAAPERIEANVSYVIQRINDNARAIGKILKASALDRAAAERISTEINRMFQKWRPILSTLEKKHGLGENGAPPIDVAMKSATDRAEMKSTKSIGSIAVKSAADRAEAKLQAHS
jgi:hypothetical protein